VLLKHEFEKRGGGKDAEAAVMERLNAMTSHEHTSDLAKDILDIIEKCPEPAD